MPAPDDEDLSPVDWRDEIPTQPDIVPLPAAAGADDVTVARCGECGEEVRKVGPYPPSDAEGALHASPRACLRDVRWAWCASHRRLSLWARAHEVSGA